MSGNGTSGPGPTGPGGESTKCGDLKFRATVESVQPSAADTLSVGDILTVELAATSTGPAVVQLQRADSAVVGAIVTRVHELIRCIQDGYAYVAEVIEIDGGNVRVQIRPA